jgi:hypothetical protein
MNWLLPQQTSKHTIPNLHPGILLLIAVFVLLLLDIRLRGTLLILVPSALIILMGLREGRSGRSLTIAGTMAAAAGIILIVQQLTGLYQIWFYAWLLVAPTALGIGQVLHGTHVGDEDLSDSGYRLIGGGIILFQMAFFLCELILGISGFGLFNSGIVLLVAPAAVVMLGIIIKLHYEDRMDVRFGP